MFLKVSLFTIRKITWIVSRTAGSCPAAHDMKNVSGLRIIVAQLNSWFSLHPFLETLYFFLHPSVRSAIVPAYSPCPCWEWLPSWASLTAASNHSIQQNVYTCIYWFFFTVNCDECLCAFSQCIHSWSLWGYNNKLLQYFTYKRTNNYFQIQSTLQTVMMWLRVPGILCFSASLAEEIVGDILRFRMTCVLIPLWSLSLFLPGQQHKICI